MSEEIYCENSLERRFGPEIADFEGYRLYNSGKGYAVFEPVNATPEQKQFKLVSEISDFSGLVKFVHECYDPAMINMQRGN